MARAPGVAWERLAARESVENGHWSYVRPTSQEVDRAPFSDPFGEAMEGARMAPLNPD
jgi:hypothetical protein